MTSDDLKQARARMGLSQSELAAALDVTPQFISMMERGLRSIERRTELAIRYLEGNTEAR